MSRAPGSSNWSKGRVFLTGKFLLISSRFFAGGQMARLSVLTLLLLFVAAPAAATDFGIRVVRHAVASTIERHVASRVDPVSSAMYGIGNVRDPAQVAARFGHITSTWRSVEHKRAVGRLPNS